MAAPDNRHILYLKEGGARSDTVYGELRHLHQMDMDDNFKVYICGRNGQLPQGIRGAPTIYYMQENGSYNVIEGRECVELVSRMCATLMRLRSDRERRIDSSARHPGRAPPVASSAEVSGGRGESFSEELFRTKHLQNRPSEAGPLQPGGFGGPKIQASDLAAWEAARIAADRAVEAQYGPSDAGQQVGQSQPYYQQPPQQGGYQQPQYQQPQYQQPQYQQPYQQPQYQQPYQQPQYQQPYQQPPPGGMYQPPPPQNGMVGNRMY